MNCSLELQHKDFFLFIKKICPDEGMFFETVKFILLHVSCYTFLFLFFFWVRFGGNIFFPTKIGQLMLLCSV